MTSFTRQSLSDGIHLAHVGEDVVVLDIANDRYACLVSGASYLAPAETLDRVGVRDDLLEQFLETGWVSPLQGSFERKPAKRPQRFISDPPKATITAFVKVAANSLAGERRFRTAPFSDILGTAERYKRRAGHAPADEDRTRAVVGQFFTVLPWLPGQGLCLHRCFMLLRYLAGHGIICDWVFGVRTWPFAAHCWLMIDDAVLGDELDRVRAFTPILVV